MIMTFMGKPVWLLFVVGCIAGVFCRRYMPWFGRLPGDIEFKVQNICCSIPLVSSMLFSVVVSLAVSVFRRF